MYSCSPRKFCSEFFTQISEHFCAYFMLWLELITLIWVSLGRSIPPAEVEYRWCQFWSKVMTSEVEQRPRLITASYGQHRSQWVKEWKSSIAFGPKPKQGFPGCISRCPLTTSHFCRAKELAAIKCEREMEQYLLVFKNKWEGEGGGREFFCFVLHLSWI